MAREWSPETPEWRENPVDWGKATTSLLAPLNSYVWTIGPVTVALGTWHSAMSPCILGCNGALGFGLGVIGPVAFAWVSPFVSSVGTSTLLAFFGFALTDATVALWCFLGLFFEVLMLLWFVFGVSGKVPKVFKMLVFFSQFWGLLWGGLFLFKWVWKV